MLKRYYWFALIPVSIIFCFIYAGCTSEDASLDIVAEDPVGTEESIESVTTSLPSESSSPYSLDTYYLLGSLGIPFYSDWNVEEFNAGVRIVSPDNIAIIVAKSLRKMSDPPDFSNDAAFTEVLKRLGELEPVVSTFSKTSVPTYDIYGDDPTLYLSVPVSGMVDGIENTGYAMCAYDDTYIYYVIAFSPTNDFENYRLALEDVILNTRIISDSQ
jgi:hypothetical protein